jgi:hypothetical protein
MLTAEQTDQRIQLPADGRGRPRWLLPTGIAAVALLSATAGVLGTGLAGSSGTPRPAAPTATAPVVPAPSGAAPGASSAASSAAPSGQGSGSGSQLTGSPSSRTSAPAASNPRASRLAPVPYQPLTAASAAAALRQAHLTASGEIRLAGRWTDRDGRNLLVATRRVDARDAAGTVSAATIRVVHWAHLESHPVLLRVMDDPSGPPCEFDFNSDLDGDYMSVADLNRDGYLDVTVAWFRSCLSEADRSDVKVAVLSNGHKYILRGWGWPGNSRPDGPGWPDAQVNQTEPAASAWPAGFHLAAERVFLRLFH